MGYHHKCVLRTLPTSGWARVVRTLSAFVVASLSALFAQVLTVLLAEQAVAEEPPTITETSLIPQSNNDVSDRESRLRDIEDELLKQLSMGATPSAQEGAKPSLPDIKHSPTPSLKAQPTAQPQPPMHAPIPVQTRAPRKATMVEAKLSEPSTTDAVTIPVARGPERTTIVPVTAKSAPHRTPKIKQPVPTEKLSAQELEHRLAIAETQITLLTKELATTKSKLAQSESRAFDLSQEAEKSTATQPQRSGEGGAIAPQGISAQGADDTDGVDTRAESYATIARITKDNTPLRIGPGSQESTITRISRNNTVTIEHRTGGWYRVVTTDGTRGWVAGSALIFDEGRSPESTVRVGAFQPALEVMDLKF